MSNSTNDPTTIVAQENPSPSAVAAELAPVNEGGPFKDTQDAVVKASRDQINNAITYLEAALETTKTEAAVVVKTAADDAVSLAFKIAEEFHFANYLALFGSTIDAGKAQVVSAVSFETAELIQKGIDKLKTLHLA